MDDKKANQRTLETHKQMIKSAKEHSEIRGSIRKVMNALLMEDVQVSALELDLTVSGKSKDKKNPLVPIKVFAEVIMGSFPNGKMMEADITKLGHFYKDEKTPTSVRVKKFSEGYADYERLFKIETYLFGGLHAIQHKRKLNDIKSLIMRDSKDEF